MKDHLHQIIITRDCFPENPRKALLEGCRIADEKFLAAADLGEKFDKAGSTAIIVLTVEKECYVANVRNDNFVWSPFKTGDSFPPQTVFTAGGPACASGASAVPGSGLT